MIDELGERMKRNENVTRFYLPRRTYTIIRLDGVSFSKYCKKLTKPFDKNLSDDIDNSVIDILKKISGVEFVYLQSDEISILLNDFKNTTTQMWFDGNIQKITSVSSAMLSSKFNELRYDRQVKYALENDIDFAFEDKWPLAYFYFDSRVFTINDRFEVMNYFRWRNNDCSRNSVSMMSQYHFSHKQLQKKSTVIMKEMLDSINQPWNLMDDSFKYGRVIKKENISEISSKWISRPAWKFVNDNDQLLNIIPKI